MGKVAKAFGVGIKGALGVVLARNEFDAGDVIEGYVTLRVTKRFACKELMLSVVGEERVSWEESSGESTSTYHHRNDILRKEIVVGHQRAYEPGEYSFGFIYQLPESLPSSFTLANRNASLMTNVSASIGYFLKALLPVTTSFSADLQASQPIAVHGQSFAHSAQPASGSASKTVRSMGLMSRGECEISAQMDQDACAAGDVLLLQTSVRNQSAVDVSSISLKLYEHLSVTVPRRSDRQGSICICETKMSGVRAGRNEDLVMSLPLVTKKELLPINPTTSTGTFVQWKYELVVKCKFKMATGVKVKMPVVVLPHARPRDAEVARVVVVAENELDSIPGVFKPTP